MAISTKSHPPIICCFRAAASLCDNSLPPAGTTHRTLWNERRKRWEVYPLVLTTLREQCPPSMPVVVRGAYLPEDTLGQCIRRQHRYVVLLSYRMKEQQAIDTLLHEWAHALAWNYAIEELGKRDDLDEDEFQRLAHDEVWGCSFSRVYRAYRELCAVM